MDIDFSGPAFGVSQDEGVPVGVFSNIPPLESSHFGASQAAINPKHDDGFVSCTCQRIGAGSDQ